MADPSTVYGPQACGWWFEQTTGTPVSILTAEVGSNLTQGTAGARPSTSTTPGGRKSLIFDIATTSDYLSGSLSPGSTTAFQLSFAFKVTSLSSGSSPVILQVHSGTFTTFNLNAFLYNDGTGVLLEIDCGSGYVSTDHNLSLGWHVAVLDVSTTGVATLYVDNAIPSGGVSQGTSSGFTGIANATVFTLGDDHGVFGSTTGSVEVCSPNIATGSSNFGSTYATNIYNALKAYISPSANGVKASSTWSARTPSVAMAVGGTKAVSTGAVRTPLIQDSISGVKAVSTWAVRAPVIAYSASPVRVGATTSVRTVKIAEAVSGSKASATATVRVPTLAFSVYGTKPTSSYSVRTPTISVAVSGLKPASTWSARAALFERPTTFANGVKAASNASVRVPVVSISVSAIKATELSSVRAAGTVLSVSPSRVSCSGSVRAPSISVAARPIRVTCAVVVRDAAGAWEIQTATRSISTWAARDAVFTALAGIRPQSAKSQWVVRKPAVTPAQPILQPTSPSAILEPRALDGHLTSKETSASLE